MVKIIYSSKSSKLWYYNINNQKQGEKYLFIIILFYFSRNRLCI